MPSRRPLLFASVAALLFLAWLAWPLRVDAPPSVAATTARDLTAREHPRPREPKPGPVLPTGSRAAEHRLSGQVIRPDGSPIGGAKVCGVAEGGVGGLATRLVGACGTTNAAGRFELVVLALPARLVPEFQDYIPLSPDTYAPIADASLPIQIVMIPGGVSVRGEVRDRAGGPIAGAAIHQQPSLRFDPQMAFVRLATTLTDDEGRFAIVADPANSDLFVEADGYVPESIPRKRWRGHVLVELDAADPSLALEGRVIDAETDRFVPQVRVELDAEDLDTAKIMVGEPSGVMTDAEGYFVFRSVSDRPHRPIVAHDGWFGRAEAVATRKPPASLLLIKVRRARVIAGSVLRANDTPAARAHVIAARDDGALAFRAVTGPDGSFVFDSVPEGPYTLEATLFEDSAPPMTWHTDRAPERARLVLPAPPEGSISGRVWTADGTPAAGAWVSVVDAKKETGSREALVSRDGTFVVDEVKEDDYWLQAFARSGSGASPRVSISVPKVGNRVAQDLQLPPVGTVTILAVEDDGTPATGVDIGLFCSPRIETLQTDSEGRAQFSHVPARPSEPCEARRLFPGFWHRRATKGRLLSDEPPAVEVRVRESEEVVVTLRVNTAP